MIGYPVVRKHADPVYPLLHSWVSGWILLYASILLPAEAGIFLPLSLKQLVLLWGGIIGIGFVYAVLLLRKDGYRPFRDLVKRLRETTPAEVLAMIPVLGHAACTFFMMHADHDDISYVGAATTSVDTNTLMRFDAVTGNLITDFAKNDMNRLVTAPQFAFYAVVSKVTRIRPAQLCHTWLPPVFTVLFFAALALVGARLFRNDRKKTGLFVIAAYAVSVFSYVSTQTAGTFILIRSWQGKAQVIGLILPMVLYLFLQIAERKESGAGDTVYLTLLFAASCLLTTMGAALTAVFAFVLAMVTAAVLRSKKVLFAAAPAFVVPAAAAVLYVLL